MSMNEQEIYKAIKKNPKLVKAIGRIMKGGPGSGPQGKGSSKKPKLTIEDKKRELDKRGILPEQYAEDKNNPTPKEIHNAHSYKYWNDKD